MQTEISVALIAFSGVLLSTLVSVVVSRREMEKLKFQVAQKYGEELLKKRIENYPRIYNCISNCVKEIRDGNWSKELLLQTKMEYEQLDSSIAIFFGVKTMNRCLAFRSKLDYLLSQDEECFIYAESIVEINDLFRVIGSFELGLQGEIGVHDVAGISAKGKVDLNFKSSYDEVD